MVPEGVPAPDREPLPMSGEEGGFVPMARMEPEEDVVPAGAGVAGEVDVPDADAEAGVDAGAAPGT